MLMTMLMEQEYQLATEEPDLDTVYRFSSHAIWAQLAFLQSNTIFAWTWWFDTNHEDLCRTLSGGN